VVCASAGAAQTNSIAAIILGIAIPQRFVLGVCLGTLASLKAANQRLGGNLAETVRDLAEDAREMQAAFDIGGTVRRFQI
jgi:hypothetical protein